MPTKDCVEYKKSRNFLIYVSIVGAILILVAAFS